MIAMETLPMRKEYCQFLAYASLIFSLAGCSYNPFIRNNQTTGDPAAAVVGAGIGAGGIGLLGGSKPLILLGGLGGSAIGYYSSTLRYDAGGVLAAGGQVYKIGDYVGVEIPTAKLFEPNSSDLLPTAKPILTSVAIILQRYPTNHILVSGNSSGFYHGRWEQKLSEARAKKIAAFLWNAGINELNAIPNQPRKLNFVGYGNYFPIAQSITHKGIRQNSRIQITSYPNEKTLHKDPEATALNNIGARENDNSATTSPSTLDRCYLAADGHRECFNND